jgi:hypothetical protein
MSIELIPVAYLQEQCLISDNVDDKKIRVAIEMAQEDLEDTIGREFYDQIKTQYEANTLTSDNNSFYDPYVKKYLAWQAYFYFVGHAQEDSTATGFRNFTDENSSLISDVNLYAKEKKIRERADRHKSKMINFLNEAQANDSTKYSLWEGGCKEVTGVAFTAIDKNGDAAATARVNSKIINNE